ncbi:MAG: hypothetical protein GY757_00560 [bacterium]|nr:hypothetical protein [bacterium]
MTIDHKKNVKDIIGLTSMQEGMLFHYLEQPENSQYVVLLSLKISGTLDTVILEQAWDAVIDKHDVLKTAFRWKKMKKPVQIILKKQSLTLAIHDFSAVGDSRKNQLLKDVKKRERQKGFDLQYVPFRVSLCKMSPSNYEMIIVNHHILYDGWSNGIILKDLVSNYVAIKYSRKMEIIPPTPFKLYIQWLSKQDKEKGIIYWKKYLAGYDKPAVSPGKRAPGMSPKYQREEYTFQIPGDISEGIRKIAADEKVSTNALIQTAWGILLYHYNNTDDVVFGVVVSGRPAEITSVDSMVGLFINMVPVRIKSGAKCSFRELAKRNQENLLLSAPFEYVPLPDIQNHSALKENLIDHLMSFQNYPLDKESFPPEEETGFVIDGVESCEQTNYDLNCVIFPGEKLSGKLLFNSQTYHPDRVKEFALHFSGILEQVVRDPGVDVKRIGIISLGEKNSQDSGENNGIDETLKKIEADFDF